MYFEILICNGNDSGPFAVFFISEELVEPSQSQNNVIFPKKYTLLCLWHPQQE